MVVLALEVVMRGHGLGVRTVHVDCGRGCHDRCEKNKARKVLKIVDAVKIVAEMTIV